MKYVVFLDILGFKNMIDALNQVDAEQFIKRFSKTVYEIFNDRNFELLSKINGYIVSDSIILYTNNTKKESLIDLLNLTLKICRSEFVENGVLIRGGIAKGEFSKLKVTEIDQLGKTLIIGQAYVNAYQLESSTKVIGVNLSEAVYNDILKYDIKLDNKENNDFNTKAYITKYKDKKAIYYLLKYIDLNFLLEANNLRQFVIFANKSKWLQHYYNALYFAIQNEQSDTKKEELFIKIEALITKDNLNTDWRMLNLFIENAFSDGVIKNFKDIFLKHIRNQLLSNRK